MEQVDEWSDPTVQTTKLPEFKLVISSNFVSCFSYISFSILELRHSMSTEFNFLSVVYTVKLR